MEKMYSTEKKLETVIMWNKNLISFYIILKNENWRTNLINWWSIIIKEIGVNNNIIVF